MNITRRIEFDAGHRIPDHRSKCRNVHGHRYRVECTVSGSVNPEVGESDDGMVRDFGDLKSLMMALIHDRFDHKMIISRKDDVLLKFFESVPELDVLVLDSVPTAENLAQVIFNVMDDAIKLSYSGDIRLTRVSLYETPNCWAEATARSKERLL